MRMVAVIIRDKAGRYLMERRSADAAWMPGFWEFPIWQVGKLPNGNIKSQSKMSDDLELGRSLGRFRHSITRFRMVVDVREALPGNGRSLPREGDSWRWETAGGIADLPATTITRKALRLLNPISKASSQRTRG